MEKIDFYYMVELYRPRMAKDIHSYATPFTPFLIHHRIFSSQFN